MRILFAIDGSDCSKAAVAAALKMRCPGGTQMKVASVVDFFEPLPALEGVKKGEIKAAEELVKETVEQLRSTHPNAEIRGVVLDGYAADEIIHVANEWQADLIMLGSHGRRGISSFVLGSVSRTVLLHANCAVRIVRKRTEEHETKDIVNVIIALDDSDHSRHLIDHALLFPWPEKTRFRCIHVVPQLADNLFLVPQTEVATALTKHYDEMIESRKHWVEAAANRINNSFDQDIATAEVLVGDAREQIIETATRWPADIVMLGSHGRRGIERMILGSVSEAVATHAPCSVEVTRVPAFRKERIHVIV